MNQWTKRKHCITAGLATLALAGMVAGCGLSGRSSGNSTVGQKVELKLAYHLPVEHHLSRSIEKFAKEVNTRTQGTIEVKTYPAGQLYTDKSMNDAILSGGLDMGLNSVAMWSTIVPAMNIMEVPFLLPTYEAADNAIDGDLGNVLSDELEKRGVHPLMWADYGFVQYCNNTREIRTPADFSGLKIRSYGQLASETIEALGGAPTTMGSGEVYMAMKNGTIDGQTSGQTAILSRKIYEVSRYMTVTNHVFIEFILAINDNRWKKLSPDQQKILTEVANEIRDEIRKETKGEDERCLQKLRNKGMNIYEVPANELKLWQDATASIREQFIADNGELGRRLVNDCLEAAEK